MTHVPPDPPRAPHDDTATQPYAAQQPHGTQPPFGDQPPYGTQPPYGDQPPYGAQPPYGEQPPYGDQPPYGAQPQYVYPVARPTSSNATVALVMGILGLALCPVLCSILAIYFAGQANAEIARTPGLEGAAMAKAGKILGIIGLVLTVVLVLVYVIGFAVLYAADEYGY
ncbi:MAG: DUF4190 domain-containing protein [Solirubrobacteraceae bacterium]|nr:DUF4190 domain-containing protein [Solirubrobacteraceae bacterium]